MKDSFNKALTYFILLVFLLYWAGIFMAAIPSTRAKEMIATKAPGFKDLFVSTWKLFAPPQTYNNRLYFIVMDAANATKPDTIEVLANLSKQKQINAPFNQKENTIDHLVQNNVIGITTIVWDGSNVQQPAWEDSSASAQVAGAIDKIKSTGNYTRYLATLKNYCKVALKEKGADLNGKKVKIVITQKMIRPFAGMNDPHFFQKEALVFETAFEPLSQ